MERCSELRLNCKEKHVVFNIDYFLNDTFAHIGVNIFEKLSHEDLMNCKLVKKQWLDFITKESQMSSVILHKGISYHITKFHKSSKQRVSKEMQSLIEEFLHCNCINELRTKHLFTRKCLPMARNELSILITFLKNFSNIEPDKLQEFVNSKNPLTFQCEFENLQYEVAKHDNFTMFHQLSKFSGTFNPRYPLFKASHITALHDFDQDISNEMKQYILEYVDDPNPKLIKVGKIDKCRSALHTAAQLGNFELFMMIADKIEHQINVKDLDGKTPYDYYVETDLIMEKLLHKRNRDFLRYLVKHSENPNPRNSVGYTPLYSAAEDMDVEAFRIIASRVPNAEDYLPPDHDFTALWWPMVNLDIDSMVKIAKETKDTNYWIVRDKRTLFEAIVEEDRVDFLKVLDCHGINIRPLPYTLFINLSKAALKGDFEMFNVLNKDAFVCREWFRETLPEFKDQYHIFEWFATGTRIGEQYSKVSTEEDIRCCQFEKIDLNCIQRG